MPHLSLLRLSVLIFLSSLLIFAGRVEAADGLRGDECVVSENEIITEDFYFMCNSLVVYGVIDGDMVGVASSINIASTGRIIGSLWVAGGQLTIEGTVENDVHFAGADLDIIGLARFPNPSTDIIAGAISVNIASEVVLPGDFIFYGYQALLNGYINGDVDFQGQSLIIGKVIGGDVNATVGDQEDSAPIRSLPLMYSVNFQNPGMRFLEEGFVTGDLEYEAPQRLRISNNVGGRVRYTQAISQANITEVEQSRTLLQIIWNYFVQTVGDIFALSVIGIIILSVFARILLEPSYRVQTRFISAFSWGLILTLLSIPTALLLLLTSLLILVVTALITLNELTIIVGILMLVLNLGFIGGVVFLLLFLGRLVTCFVVGFFMVRALQELWGRYKSTVPRFMGELWFAMILGVAVISIITNLPMGAFVGLLQLLLTGLISFAGFGAIFMYLRDLWYVRDRRWAAGHSSNAPLRAVPPPPDDDLDISVNSAAVGMDNLPTGFKWFDD